MQNVDCVQQQHHGCSLDGSGMQYPLDEDGYPVTDKYMVCRESRKHVRGPDIYILE